MDADPILPTIRKMQDMADWRYEVANGDTRLGFDEWLEHRQEMEDEP